MGRCAPQGCRQSRLSSAGHRLRPPRAQTRSSSRFPAARRRCRRPIRATRQLPARHLHALGPDGKVV